MRLRENREGEEGNPHVIIVILIMLEIIFNRGAEESLGLPWVELR